jgi:hypothetical protein
MQPLLPPFSSSSFSPPNATTTILVYAELVLESLRPDTWRYLYYDVQPNDERVVVSVSRITIVPDGNGDPDFYFLTPNTTAANEQAARTMTNRRAAAVVRAHTYPTMSYFSPTYTNATADVTGPRVRTSPVVVCDNCPCDPSKQRCPPAVHTVEFKETDLFTSDDGPPGPERQGGGTLVLGVWENCCEGARAEISVTVYRRNETTT